MITRRALAAAVTLALLAPGGAALVQAASGIAAFEVPVRPSTRTQIVFLGTGMPSPDPERSGPCVAVVVDNSAYLVDMGPGLVRRAAAAYRNGDGVKALKPTNLRIVFVTHLHSDHTVGYPDLIFTPWVVGRTAPLEVYGPRGLKAMTHHILAAYREDIDIRIHGLEGANTTGYKVNVHEIKPGVVYRDQNVTVTAFPVQHGSWPQAFGYRFDTPGRKIVISGDCRPSPALLENARGCDVLIHEVYSTGGLTKRVGAGGSKYFPAFHTSSQELAEIATKTKPGLLILYHQVMFGATEEELLDEIRRGYSGKVVASHDLDID